jgi:hypothetical protein
MHARSQVSATIRPPSVWLVSLALPDGSQRRTVVNISLFLQSRWKWRSCRVRWQAVFQQIPPKNDTSRSQLILGGRMSRTAPRVGLEPTTLRLTAACSTIELSRNIRKEQSDPACITGSIQCTGNLGKSQPSLNLRITLALSVCFLQFDFRLIFVFFYFLSVLTSQDS